MAIQGLSSFLHAQLNEVAKTYGSATKTGGAIEVKESISYNDTPIYSDNRLKKKDTTFKEGKIALIVDYANKTVLSPILGKTISDIAFTTSGGAVVATTKYVSNSNDKPIPQGFGYIIKDLDVDLNKDIYTVKFFYKVEFQPYTHDAKTKEGSKTYTYTTLEGTIFELEDGNWCEEEDFETEIVAIEYLKSLFTATCTTPVANIAAGTYATAKTVALTAGVGEKIYYTVNGLTPSATVGTLYSTAISITASTMLRAVATKVGSSNSAIAEYEYNITA